MPGAEDDKRRKTCESGGGLQRLHAPPAKWFMNLLLLALVPACFALNPVIGRAMAEALGPASLSVIRWAFSAIIVALLALSRGEGERWRAPAGYFLRVGALGALGMGFCAYAAFEGARTSPATNIALIYGCTSAFVAAWEIAAGRQKLTAALVLGIAACLAGVVLIVTRGHPEVLQNLNFTPGDLWATAGMFVFVAYTVDAAAHAGDPYRPAAVRGHELRRDARAHAVCRCGDRPRICRCSSCG